MNERPFQYLNFYFKTVLHEAIFKNAFAQLANKADFPLFLFFACFIAQKKRKIAVVQPEKQ